jgi:hypothetical protein
MKTNETTEKNGNTGGGNTFRKACANSCKRILTQITKAKEAILAEARDTLNVRDHLLRLALNEAEALASQTLCPHLVFPALAVEKVQAVAAWERRQRQLGGRSRTWPL